MSHFLGTHPQPGRSAPALTWVTLALMTTSSVASLRAAPAMAVYGLACVFLYLAPAVVFRLPTALVSAELASGWSGGVYRWVSEGLTKPLGFLAVWCQFAMTIFSYPSLLAFVASTISYVIDPALASNGLHTAIVIMVLYWTGVRVSSRGTKALAGLSSWGLIVNNFLSYSGMEMNAVHVSSLKDPAKEYPKSMFLAMGLVLLIFILPALAISWVVPSDQTSLTAGVMQAFNAFFSYFHIGWMTPIAAVMLVSASLGGMLTPFLQKLNRFGVQQNILVTQGVVTTVIALGYALLPNVSNVYWIFSTITTQVYLIVHLLMFVAAMRLRKTQPDHPRGYRVPALHLLCTVGLLASVAALAIGFVPPSQFGGGSVWSYVGIIGGGLVILGLLIPWAFLKFRRPSWRTTAQAEDGTTAGDVA
ncbi:APC family permease [Streptomyces sp. NBC_01515]|uniref:APC family permease n=1 Tax=Streptomyces sp. NBC_01515 TaxID=2903890 RepID=UPI003865AB4C